jgi:hypothetical protein
MALNIRSIYVILYLCNRTESGCDFPIVRCPLVLQRGGDAHEYDESTYSVVSCLCSFIIH